MLNTVFGKIKKSQLIILVINTVTHCVTWLGPASAIEIEVQEEGIKYKDDTGTIIIYNLGDFNVDQCTILQVPLLPASVSLGINSNVQYTSLTPEHYAPPHLHITMGLINFSVFFVIILILI